MQAATYSYHTFYFPFLWDCGEKASAFSASLVARGWQPDDLLAPDEIEVETDTAQIYQAFQYFTKPARNSIFGLGQGIVKNYCYCPEKVHDKAFYHIEKNGEVFDLPLHALRLKLFNTGIGLLIFETENQAYPSMDAVKKINAYGRRTFAPYLSDTNLLCADVLGIRYAKDHMEYTNLKETFAEKNATVKTTFIPQFIVTLLGDTICPAVDDRMFVTTLVNDAAYFNQVSQYETDADAAADLYEFIYIDTPGACSCPTEEMRRKILEKSVYARWMECGTLHAVSHYSFVCITGERADARENVYYSVIQPFLIQYTQMVSIVLAQRASIIAFDALAADLSAGFEKKGRNLKRKKLLQLLFLQEKYIAFQNQLMNVELTCQDQGIELYEALQNSLYIEKSNCHLSGEIERLYEAANVNQAYTFNKLALWIAILAIIVPILTEFLFK